MVVSWQPVKVDPVMVDRWGAGQQGRKVHEATQGWDKGC